MSEAVEFRTKAAADAARDEFSDHVCPIDDDRRKKTVYWQDDTPDSVRDQIESIRDEAAGGEDAGQIELTDTEKRRLDFAAEGSNVLKARSVKGIADKVGVSDWTAHYDRDLTVDEHREVLRNVREAGGSGGDGDRNDAEQRQADAARTQQAQQCNHAENACRNNQPEACEFLREVCGLSESDVDRLLSDDPELDDVVDSTPETDTEAIEKTSVSGGALRAASVSVDDRPDPETADPVRSPEGFAPDEVYEEMRGQDKGAFARSIGGYLGATRELTEAIEKADAAMRNAQAAAKAIDGIRTTYGLNPLHYERLEDSNAELLDLVRTAAAVCRECHADHSEHDHSVTLGDVEDLREFLQDGATGTPVGIGDENLKKLTEFDAEGGGEMTRDPPLNPDAVPESRLTPRQQLVADADPIDWHGTDLPSEIGSFDLYDYTQRYVEYRRQKTDGIGVIEFSASSANPPGYYTVVLKTGPNESERVEVNDAADAVFSLTEMAKDDVMTEEPDGAKRVIDAGRRSLDGDQADQQATFAGSIDEHDPEYMRERNPGGLMADERDDPDRESGRDRTQGVLGDQRPADARTDSDRKENSQGLGGFGE